MTITVSGLGSGLSYDSWIEELVNLKQAQIDKVSTQVSTIQSKETTLNTIKSDYTSLLDAIENLNSTISSTDVFNQKTATSSSDAVSASVTYKATAQNLNVSVSKLATSTTATSSSVAAAYVSGSSKVSDVSQGAITAGTMSVYVNGTKNTVNIATDDTLDSVMTKLNAISGVSSSLSSDGKLTIKSSDSSTYNVVVGSSSDTSNFTKTMSLVRNTTSGDYVSSKSLFSTNASTSLIGASFAGGAVTAGSFTIGNTKFTIDSSTTLTSLIANINSSSAGVTASWDSNAGKLLLTSTDQGAYNINVTAGDGTAGYTGASNFTDIMGLTTSTWNGDGTLATTAIKTGSQTLGSNAVLSINGTEITSSSNTVTSDVSGIAGLTLTLNSTTSSAATVAVKTDSTAITNAITKMVDAYNTAITATDTATATDGKLHGESVLTSIRNKVRSSITAAVGTSSSSLKSLADIGITTGAYSTDTSANTTTLKVDSTKLANAISSNADAVKTLLVGDKTTSTKGVLSDIDTVLTNATDASKGYFATTTKYYDSQISNLNKKVSSMTTEMAHYKSQLEAKFSAMDTIISNLKSQSSAFDSYFNKSSSSS